MIDLGIPVPTVPYLTINDKYMGKTNPTMRYLSKQLGEYTADNDLYEHYLDSMADLCRDWFNAWVTPHYLTKPNGPAEEEYQANVAPLYHNGVEKELGKNNSGPYILGEKVK
jgi:hypothetical protein